MAKKRFPKNPRNKVSRRIKNVKDELPLAVMNSGAQLVVKKSPVRKRPTTAARSSSPRPSRARKTAAAT